MIYKYRNDLKDEVFVPSEYGRVLDLFERYDSTNPTYTFEMKEIRESVKETD